MNIEIIVFWISFNNKNFSKTILREIVNKFPNIDLFFHRGVYVSNEKFENMKLIDGESYPCADLAS